MTAPVLLTAVPDDGIVPGATTVVVTGTGMASDGTGVTVHAAGNNATEDLTASSWAAGFGGETFHITIPVELAGPYGGDVSLTVTTVDGTSAPLVVSVNGTFPTSGGLNDEFRTTLEGQGSPRIVPVSDVVELPASWGDLPLGHRPSALPERNRVLTPGPYMIIGGRPVGAPTLGASGRTYCRLGNTSDTADLAAAASLGDLGATARWLPDTSSIVAHHSIGSDISVWEPAYGSADAWRIHNASAPWVDPDFAYYARHEKLVNRPSLVFDGNSWAQAHLGNIDAFSFVMVVVIHHPKNTSWSDLIASPSSAADASRATDASLRYQRGWVAAYVGANMSRRRSHAATHKHRRRPVIIGWGENNHNGMLGIIDGHGRHLHSYNHHGHGSYDGDFYLGVNGAKPTASYAANLDVLDLVYFDSLISNEHFSALMHKLNGVYGVSGR